MFDLYFIIFNNETNVDGYSGVPILHIKKEPQGVPRAQERKGEGGREGGREGGMKRKEVERTGKKRLACTIHTVLWWVSIHNGLRWTVDTFYKYKKWK